MFENWENTHNTNCFVFETIVRTICLQLFPNVKILKSKKKKNQFFMVHLRSLHGVFNVNKMRELWFYVNMNVPMYHSWYFHTRIHTHTKYQTGSIWFSYMNRWLGKRLWKIKKGSSLFEHFNIQNETKRNETKNAVISRLPMHVWLPKSIIKRSLKTFSQRIHAYFIQQNMIWHESES